MSNRPAAISAAASGTVPMERWTRRLKYHDTARAAATEASSATATVVLFGVVALFRLGTDTPTGRAPLGAAIGQSSTVLGAGYGGLVRVGRLFGFGLGSKTLWGTRQDP